MLYTSRYANPVLKSGEYVVVAISRGTPKYPLGYEIAGKIIDIAPSGWLLNENNKERFSREYRKQLNKTGVEKIAPQLNKYTASGKDVVLCCWEDIRNPDLFCHRTNFAEWWTEMTGEVVLELEDSSKNKWEKSAEPVKLEDKQEEPFFEQLSLF